METPRIFTRIGEDIAIIPSDDVTIIFENILSEGYTTIDKPEMGPEPPTGLDIECYYDIQTTARIKGKIKIRIIIEQDMISKRNRRLWQWHEKIKQWKDITKYFNWKYHLIVGETDHLSIFGIT